MKLDILAFAAHPDDIELSASGTLMKHIHEGRKVGIVDLTEGQLGSRGSVELRYQEAAKASKIMGLSARHNLRMEDGFFEHNQTNLIRIIEQIRRFSPEIVLANAPHDRHPDHGRASKLVADACFYAGLRKIETSWEGKKQEAIRPKALYFYIQDEYMEPDFVVDISDFVERKFESIMAYSSQFFNPNSTEPITPISGEDFIDFMRGRMRQFARPIGVEYAEGFVKHRNIGVKSLFDLI
jgi:N-acetylglucosamine malate deacetylase 1